MNQRQPHLARELPVRVRRAANPLNSASTTLFWEGKGVSPQIAAWVHAWFRGSDVLLGTICLFFLFFFLRFWYCARHVRGTSARFRNDNTQICGKSCARQECSAHNHSAARFGCSAFALTMMMTDRSSNRGNECTGCGKRKKIHVAVRDQREEKRGKQQQRQRVYRLRKR